MKKLLLIILVIITSFANAQDESTYLQYYFKTLDINTPYSYSSEYFDGKVWFFVAGMDEVYYHPMSVSDEGKLEDMDHHTKFCPVMPELEILRLNTVVFNQKLYLFYFNAFWPYPDGCLWYTRIKEDGHYHLLKAEDLNFTPEHEHKMAAVAVEDTLYLFYTEKHTGYLKYFKGIPTENNDEIQWLSDNPTELTDSTGTPLKSVGNVAACTYFTPDNKERIMLLYPSDKFNDDQNYLVFYSGNGTQFSFHHQIASFPNSSIDWTAKFVSLAQGSVKGGWAKQYVMQAAYVTKGESLTKDTHVEMFRHEFNLTTGAIGGLEQIPVHGEAFYSMAPDFMEYYIPDGNVQEIRKYLYLVYNFRWGLDQYAQVNQWNSDLLTLIGNVTEFSPDYLKEELWHLIFVLEGPPPFVLNGWTMYELWIGNKYPPSSFIYGQSSTYTVGSNTIYKKTIEASGGFGPITGGFKRSMQHNNNNSTTDETSLSVVTTIKPPTDSADAEGLMFSFYDAPSLMRSQWRLHDYNGDTLNVDHSLFLFNFTDPQLNFITTSFTEYSKSPRLNDIYSYEERNIEYFPGIKDTIPKDLQQDIAGGGSQTLSFTFDTLYSNTTEMTKTVKVGIDAKYKIFNIQAGYEVTIDYTTENNTKNATGFQLTYQNPLPKVPNDSTNIKSYTTVAHLTKTIDSTAYFLPDGFKDHRPIFFTWGVKDIDTGATFYFINEKAFVKKYNFRCYPNPASSNCYFTFDLRESSNVQLILYDAMGHNKELLLNEIIPDGHNNIEYSVGNLAPGLYFYKLQIGHDILDGKLMVIH